MFSLKKKVEKGGAYLGVKFSMLFFNFTSARALNQKNTVHAFSHIRKKTRNGRMERWMDKRTDGQTDGQTDPHIEMRGRI